MNQHLPPHKPPAVVRAANWLARPVAKRLVALDPESLQRRATRVAGLSDFDADETFEQGLEALCKSVEEDARLSFVGRLAFRDYMQRTLVNRLRYVHARQHEPEVEQVDLVPPIIVLGLPRSGTTLLHHLLACDPRARPLRFWELMEPIAGPGGDNRRAQTQKALARARWMNRTLDAKHHFGADNPEECVLLLDPTLISPSFWVFAPVHTYLSWLRGQDFTAAYEVYRWYLQRFQRETPSQRLVLKAPAHTAAVSALLHSIPNARLVQTHRDPASVVPSANSLVHSLHSLVSDPLDVPRMRKSNLEHLEHLVAASEQARTRSGGWVDVHYEALVRDPIACVRQIYDRLELELCDGMLDAMQQHLTDRPQRKYGRHDYAQEEAVRARFSSYIRDRLPG